QVQCAIPQSFGVVAFDLLNQIGIAVNVAIVIVYGSTFYVLRKSGASSKMKTVFKSIAVTVIIVLCGWLCTFLINSVALIVSKDVYTTIVINMYAGIAVNIGLASNVFVYYAINTEYRDVIREMFGYTGKVKKAQEVSTMHGLASRTKTGTSGISTVHK
ncbi:hypothetical protein TELCIR_18681, partial [Teladorsagia circumcincta]